MQLGVIGLGVMGRNLALNFAEKDVSVVAWDASPKARADVPSPVSAVPALSDLVGRLGRPRRILICVPAGPAVDDVLAALAPLLDPGDSVIDGGNSHYRDTIARAVRARQTGVEFVGLGISGGEQGARRGPALMLGGKAEILGDLSPLLAVAAARVEGVPCLALIEGDGGGHFVKAAHNGIEYALMQVLAEAYAFLRHGSGLSHRETRDHVAGWMSGRLSSYLLDITVRVLDHVDPDARKPMVECIRDRVAHKGTGAWAAAAGLELGAATPTIAAAVAARAVSALPRAGAAAFSGPSGAEKSSARAVLEDAVVVAFLAAFCQGFDLIRAGATAFGWKLDAAHLGRSWQAGSIVRAHLLDTVAESAAEAEAPLFLAKPIQGMVSPRLAALRGAVVAAAGMRTPAPALSSALAYADALLGGPLGANLIAAQRDVFGRHGFERVDREGIGHAQWNPLPPGKP